MSDTSEQQIDEALAMLRLLEGPDNVGFVKKVVAIFLEDTPKQLFAAKQGLDANDLDLLGRSAHSMKSSMASLGGMDASEIAMQIEKKTRSGSIEGVPLLLTQLQNHFDQLKLILKSRV